MGESTKIIECLQDSQCGQLGRRATLYRQGTQAQGGHAACPPARLPSSSKSPPLRPRQGSCCPTWRLPTHPLMPGPGGHAGRGKNSPESRPLPHTKEDQESQTHLGGEVGGELSSTRSWSVSAHRGGDKEPTAPARERRPPQRQFPGSRR